MGDEAEKSDQEQAEIDAIPLRELINAPTAWLDKLSEAGYETSKDLAAADVEEVADATGFNDWALKPRINKARKYQAGELERKDRESTVPEDEGAFEGPADTGQGDPPASTKPSDPPNPVSEPRRHEKGAQPVWSILLYLLAGLSGLFALVSGVVALNQDGLGVLVALPMVGGAVLSMGLLGALARITEDLAAIRSLL